MRARRAATSFASIALIGAAHAQSRVDAIPEPLHQAGADVIAAFKSGDLPAIEARFDAAMRTALPHDRFVASDAAFAAERGPLVGCDEPTAQVSNRLTLVDYPCTFGKGQQTLRLVWNENVELAGYSYVPAPVLTPLPPNVREVKATTGARGWSLPGYLMLPAPANRTPVVVLVQGSGPLDRDETIGPNKPLRDLAIGLAARGIASLRYDKRTYALRARFASELPNWTLDDQIVDDAVAAVEVVAARRDVGPVLIVGHSEGGWLAPRIAAKAATKGVEVAGVALLAANVTPLADLIVQQMEFAAKRPSSPVTAAMVADAKTRRDRVRRLVESGSASAASEPLPLDMPASAWLDVVRYDPANTLLAQPLLPALLMFGGRDFQVPIREEALWQSRLGARANTVFVDFPSVNHLLIEGGGPMSPDEYAKPGHVSEALLDRLAEWINERAQVSSRSSSDGRGAYRGIVR